MMSGRLSVSAIARRTRASRNGSRSTRIPNMLCDETGTVYPLNLLLFLNARACWGDICCTRSSCPARSASTIGAGSE